MLGQLLCCDFGDAPAVGCERLAVHGARPCRKREFPRPNIVAELGSCRICNGVCDRDAAGRLIGISSLEDGDACRRIDASILDVDVKAECETTFGSEMELQTS